MDEEFENGYVPQDEPPGIEEREYAKWKAAGGQVRSAPPTPGPWFLFGNPAHCVGGPFVPGPDDNPQQTTAGVAMCGMRLRTNLEAAANARLIAAAPDLLAALRSVVHALCERRQTTSGACDTERQALASALAAIAKATVKEG